MAQKFNKNDLVEFIQDSIEMNQGLSPSIVKDIESIVKTQVEMGDADDFIKSIDNDNHEIKRLLEDVLDGKVQQEVVINDNTTTNVISNAAGITSEDRSFKEELTKQISNNNNIMVAAGDKLQQGMDHAYNTFGSQVDTILGEEKTNVIDPMIKITKGIGGLFGSFMNPEEKQLAVANKSASTLGEIRDLTQDSRQALEESQSEIIKTQTKSIDLAQEASKSLEELNDSQSDTLQLAKKEALRDQREKKDDGGDKSSFLGSLVKGAIITYLIGMGIGAMVGYIIKPFQVMADVAKVVVGQFITVGAQVKRTGSLFAKISSMLEELSIVKGIGAAVKGVATFLRGFRSWSRVLRVFDTIKSVFGMLMDIPNNIMKLIRFASTIGDSVDKGTKTLSLLEKIPLLGKVVTSVVARVTSIVQSVKDLSKGTGIIGNLLRGVSKTYRGFVKVLKFVRPIISRLSLFTKGFARGLTKLAWPLTILMGVVDFFKGFFGSDEKTFMGKLLDGVSEVLVGFFELPIRVLGWLYDKVLGLFGVESSGTGDKLVAGFRSLLDGIFQPIKDTFVIISDTVSSVFGSIVDIVKSVFGIITNTVGFFWNLLHGDMDGVKQNLSNIWDNVKSIVEGFFNIIMKYVTMPFKVLGTYFTSIWETVGSMVDLSVFDPLISLFTKIGEFMNGIGDWVKNKLASIPGIGGWFNDDEKPEVKEPEKPKKSGGWFSWFSSDDDINENKPTVEKKVESLQKSLKDGQTKKIDNSIIKRTEVVRRATTKTAKKSGGFFSSVGDLFMGGKKGVTTGVYKPEGYMGDSISKPMSKSVIDGNQMMANEKNKSDSIKKQVESSDNVSMAINKMSKDSKDNGERPIIVNTGSNNENSRFIEPPEDIEAMSILFLNKSWGLG